MSNKTKFYIFLILTVVGVISIIYGVYRFWGLTLSGIAKGFLYMFLGGFLTILFGNLAKLACIDIEVENEQKPFSEKLSSFSDTSHSYTYTYTDYPQEDSDIFYASLVGMRYREDQEPIKALTLETEVFFVQEPENTHDSNAIMVKDEYGNKLGYISASSYEQIRINQLINDGTKLYAEIYSISSTVIKLKVMVL